MSEPNELTTTEAAARLDHLNVVELRNAIRRGEVEAEKRNRRYYISGAEVERLEVEHARRMLDDKDYRRRHL